MLDGEIAAPVETCRPGRCASAGPSGSPIFAFDLLHLDGHDLRRCHGGQKGAAARWVKFFGRYRAGWLRDRVPSSVG